MLMHGFERLTWTLSAVPNFHVDVCAQCLSAEHSCTRVWACSYAGWYCMSEAVKFQQPMLVCSSGEVPAG